MIRRIAAAAAAVLLCVAGLAQAQGWPNKSVKFINPFPAGGGVDAFARPIAAKLTAQLGQTFYVENMGGAGGTVGAAAAARAAPEPSPAFSIRGEVAAVDSEGRADEVAAVPEAPTPERPGRSTERWNSFRFAAAVAVAYRPQARSGTQPARSRFRPAVRSSCKKAQGYRRMVSGGEVRLLRAHMAAAAAAACCSSPRP